MATARSARSAELRSAGQGCASGASLLLPKRGTLSPSPEEVLSLPTAGRPALAQSLRTSGPQCCGSMDPAEGARVGWTRRGQWSCVASDGPLCDQTLR